MSKTIWTGRVISALTGIFMLTGGINLIFVRSADLREGFAKFGYAESALLPIGIALLVSAVLYLIPRTTILGAILLTGYLGGAVATHVRISDPVFFAPLTVGILIWLGLCLRNSALRTLFLRSRTSAVS